MLGLRSSLEIKLANNQALAIVFQLEYVFSAPIGRETMVSSKSCCRCRWSWAGRISCSGPSYSRSDEASD
ncbi:hypothetical protein ATANTOWER_013738 [Ataeniobius toweri]|uniref:Uncharacterized protein n=1 Tax=Ataeniobius toweri TaxID=208326 RepID=A0ABU7BIL8_9TELE|nr:hypothetical protein [Ataeniobius toweri]